MFVAQQGERFVLWNHWGFEVEVRLWPQNVMSRKRVFTSAVQLHLWEDVALTQPVAMELAGEYEGKVRIVKMNIDDNPAAPGRYGVRAIPTLLAFQGGQVVEQMQGARPKSALEEMVQRLT